MQDTINDLKVLEGDKFQLDNDIFTQLNYTGTLNSFNYQVFSHRNGVGQQRLYSL